MVARKAAAVVVRFKGDTNALNRSADKAKKKLSGLQKAGQVMSKALLVGVGAAAAGFVHSAKKFDEAQSIIGKATGKTGQDLKDLTDEFRNVFAQQDKTPEEIAQVVGTLDTLVDGTTEQIGRLTLGLEDLSDVIGGDVVANSDKFGRATALWGLNADKAASSLDTLTAVGQDYGIQGDLLLTQLQKHGETFKAMGLTLDESAIAMGKLYSAGTDVRSLASGLEIFGGKVIDLGGDPAVELAKLTEAMKNAKSETEAAALAMEVGFSDKAAFAYASAVANGIEITGDFAEEINSARGRLDEQATANETLTEKLDILKNKFIEVGMRIADKFLPRLQKIIDWMMEDGNLNKALIALTVAVGGLFTAKVITGIASLATAIKGIGIAAGVAGGSAGMALLLGKLAVIVAGAAALGWVIAKLDALDKKPDVYSGMPGNLGAKPEPTTYERLRHLGVVPEGPSGIPDFSPEEGFGYPQGGLPIERPEIYRPLQTSGHPSGRTVTPKPRTGHPDIRPVRIHPGTGQGIPAYAEGGYVDKPTLALIGEAGPEYVVPESKMGNTTINIYADGIITEQHLQGLVSRAMNRASKHNPAVFRPFNEGLQGL